MFKMFDATVLILFYVQLSVCRREDRMIYEGPSFLVVVWFDSCPNPTLSSACYLSFSVFLCAATGRAYWRERVGEARERLALYKSLNTVRGIV